MAKPHSACPDPHAARKPLRQRERAPGRTRWSNGSLGRTREEHRFPDRPDFTTFRSAMTRFGTSVPTGGSSAGPSAIQFPADLPAPAGCLAREAQMAILTPTSTYYPRAWLHPEEGGHSGAERGLRAIVGRHNPEVARDPEYAPLQTTAPTSRICSDHADASYPALRRPRALQPRRQRSPGPCIGVPCREFPRA